MARKKKAQSLSDETRLQFTQYDDVYMEGAFLAWYTAGRVTLSKLHEVIEKDRNGRIPDFRTLEEWSKVRNWNERADLLDLQVSREVEHRAVEEKVEMLRRHADAGKVMVDKGYDYIKTYDISRMADAIQMMVKGVELERMSRGMPEALTRIADMEDESLLKLVNELMKAPDSADLVNKEMEKPNKPDAVIIDAEFEE